jgi:hypothetical protein
VRGPSFRNKNKPTGKIAPLAYWLAEAEAEAKAKAAMADVAREQALVCWRGRRGRWHAKINFIILRCQVVY